MLVSVAIKHDNVHLVQLLIQKYNVECDSTQVLKMKCNYIYWYGNDNKTTEFIKLLLKKGAQMGCYYKTVIEQFLPTPYIFENDLHSYFREGYNINSLCKYYTERRDKYCANDVRWFLRHGLNTHAQFIQTCIEKALKTHNYEIVTLLLHAGVERFAITK